MRYISTRLNSPVERFSEILLKGLAPDGGLYVPFSYPRLPLASLRGKSYIDVATEVLGRFAPEIPREEMRGILEKTYTKEAFGSTEITPVQMLKPGLGLLKLSNGPTLAFKDVPLQLLGNLLERQLALHDETLTVLGATSGDTGSAAEAALKGKKGITLFMLSPKGRMSEFQRKQMYTIDDPHIWNIVVDGNFDDCQAMVKAVNADLRFKERYAIGAINSINWARIAAQTVYYVYGYLRATREDGERVTFAIPSGNFGNAFSAYVARLLGVPIDIIVATNENDVLDTFFHTGLYRIRKGKDVKITSSPSMDIASASNFERLVFELVRDDGRGRVAELWENLSQRGEFTAEFLLTKARAGIVSGSATEGDVIDTIQKIADLGTIIDPHTAVGMCVGLRLRSESQKLIVAETAQPAKFADTIREAIGFDPPMPAWYGELKDLPERTHAMSVDAEALKRFIAARVS